MPQAAGELGPQAPLQSFFQGRDKRPFAPVNSTSTQSWQTEHSSHQGHKRLDSLPLSAMSLLIRDGHKCQSLPRGPEQTTEYVLPEGYGLGETLTFANPDKMFTCPSAYLRLQAPTLMISSRPPARLGMGSRRAYVRHGRLVSVT